MTPPRTHLSARWRLTLGYTALFFVASVVLLSLNYFLVDRSLTQNRDEIRNAVADQLGISPNEVRTSERGEVPDADDREVFRNVQDRIAHEHLEHLLTESGIALAAMTVASLGIGWLIAGRVLRPVHRMTTTARELSETNLHERIALDGPDDELKELADTFDAMLARLEAAFDAQRRFVADASHELRTPLAIIRAEVDVTLADQHATNDELRAMGATVRDATERSEQLIDSLLVLARSDSARLASEPTDLATIACAWRSSAPSPRSWPDRSWSSSRWSPQSRWATPRCSRGSSKTWSRTRCGTTSSVVGSRSTPVRPGTACRSESPMPAPRSTRARWKHCSIAFTAQMMLVGVARPVSASGCRSWPRSPRRTTARCAPKRSATAVSS